MVWATRRDMSTVGKLSSDPAMTCTGQRMRAQSASQSLRPKVSSRSASSDATEWLAQAPRHLGITLRPGLEPRERRLAHSEAQVRVEVFLEAAGLDEWPMRGPPGLVAGRRRVRRPADRDDGADPRRHVDGRPQRQRRAHGGAAPHRALDPESVEPQHEVLELLRVRIVRGSLELAGQTMAARIGKEGPDAREERLEVRQHGRGVLDGAPMNPDDGRLRGVPALPPVEADAVRQPELRQGSGAAPRAARSGTWSTCRPSTPPR